MTGYGLREHMILAIAGVFASQDHDRHCRRASLLAQLSAQRARSEAKYGPAEAMQARMAGGGTGMFARASWTVWPDS